MEAASLVLATLVFVKPICETIQSTLTNYSHYAKDADSLRLRFADARLRLVSFEKILCTRDKFAPAIKGRLVDSLDASTLEVLGGLVEELRFGLEQYVALKAHHEQRDIGLSDPNAVHEEGTPHSTLGSNALASSGNNASSTLNSVATAKLKLISTSRRIRWTMSRRNTTQNVVENFEQWTTRMRNIVEAVLWSIPVGSTIEQIRALQQDSDASNVGLLQGIRLRELLVTPPSDLEPHVDGLYARAFQKSYSIDGFDVGTIQREKGLYLIEYKTGDDGIMEGISSRTREQIVKLAALLRDAPSSDEGLGVLSCTAYIEDPSHDKIGLVHALPSTYTTDSLQPKTLSDLLLTSTSPKISLDYRLRIACSIFYTVHRLHMYGWVHKSLRADNVLFLPNQPDNNELGYNLAEPKLLGFDWARKDDEISPQEAGLEIRRNIYRHPRRWGQPTTRFEKIHDIYALGVILLELGLGVSIKTIENGALVKESKYHDCDVLSKRLVHHAKQRLGFYCGTRIQGIIIGCLTGSWRGTSVATQLADIVMALMEITEASGSESL